MRSLRTWLQRLTWPGVALLLLGGCTEGQKATPLKRGGAAAPAQNAPPEASKRVGSRQ